MVRARDDDKVKTSERQRQRQRAHPRPSVHYNDHLNSSSTSLHHSTEKLLEGASSPLTVRSLARPFARPTRHRHAATHCITPPTSPTAASSTTTASVRHRRRRRQYKRLSYVFTIYIALRVHREVVRESSRRPPVRQRQPVQPLAIMPHPQFCFLRFLCRRPVLSIALDRRSALASTDPLTCSAFRDPSDSILQSNNDSNDNDDRVCSLTD